MQMNFSSRTKSFNMGNICKWAIADTVCLQLLTLGMTLAMTTILLESCKTVSGSTVMTVPSPLTLELENEMVFFSCTPPISKSRHKYATYMLTAAISTRLQLLHTSSRQCTMSIEYTKPISTPTPLSAQPRASSLTMRISSLLKDGIRPCFWPRPSTSRCLLQTSKDYSISSVPPSGARTRKWLPAADFCQTTVEINSSSRGHTVPSSQMEDLSPQRQPQSPLPDRAQLAAAADSMTDIESQDRVELLDVCKRRQVRLRSVLFLY